MHRNGPWLAFLAIVVAVTLWFGGRAAYSLYGYYALTQRSETLSTQWTVKEISSDEFIPYATYTFRVGEEVIQGESGLDHALYRNPNSVQKDLAHLARRSWTVWYSGRNPHYSALERHFPYKDVLYAACLLGLLLYFVGLGYYAEHLQTKK